MWLYLLFTVVAFGQTECETSTCAVCKTNSSCDWYGFDCLSKTSSEVTTLSLPATATCPTCQAGSCSDCQNQAGCAWFSSEVPGVPGKCDVNTSTTASYDMVATCPSCYLHTDCASCVEQDNATSCGWYVLPGGINGKCREASPSFAYTKVPADSCSSGSNPCAGVSTCSSCQGVGNCSWYSSKSPSFYNSKCDDSQPNVVDSSLYTQVTGSCPACAGISCLTCKAESGCKWVAVQGLTGIAFGECLVTTASNPVAKTPIATCPATCQVYSCQTCASISACNWFTGSKYIDDSCDLASDAKLQHPTQTAITASSSCGACMADRCYECNNLAGCGWYANKLGSLIIEQGCYATNNFPSGRTLLPNGNSKCEGSPSSSASTVASLGLLLVLALLA